MRRFGGIERLYGEGALDRLAAAHVCVVGIGGVGSWAAEALARSGVGRLSLVDLDHVAESNINRQIHALEDTLGQAKVAAMQARIAQINPDCEVAAVEEFVSPENVAILLPPCDFVVDATDQVRAKAALIGHCRARSVAVVTTGAAGGKTDPAMIRVDDLSRTTQDPLAAKLRATLRRHYGFPRDARKRFGVECVYSLEPLRRPALPACDVDLPVAGDLPKLSRGNTPAHLHGLACAGYGSSVCVTAAFGFAAASRVLARLAAP